jgi:uncharacterized protein YkwD
MKRLINFSWPALALFFLAPSSGQGQTSEPHTIEHLEASELGPFEPVKTPDLEEAEKLIVEQTNQFREEQGREKLAVDETLAKTAAEFARYMARTDKYGHRADDRNPSERASAQGYQYCLVSENIAYQFRSQGFQTKKLMEGFVEGWKDSPGHRENMLEPDVTQTGVAVAQSESTGVFYAVQMFGRPQSAKIEFRLSNPTETSLEYQIADQKFSLPPRYARKHTLCRPSELKWQPQPNAETDQQPRTIEPDDGDEFEVQRKGEEILIQPMNSAATSSSQEN